MHKGGWETKMAGIRESGIAEDDDQTKKSNGKIIAFLRSTSVKYEPAVKRKAIVSYSCGFEPHIIYWDRKNIEQVHYEEPITYIPIRVGKTSYGRGIFNLYKRLLFTFKLVGKLRNVNPYAIHACDLDTVIPAVAYKFLFRRDTRIVYDILDFIQTFSSPIPNCIRNILTKIDRFAMGISTYIIIPDENRLNFIPRKYRPKIRIIYNCPDISFCYLPKCSVEKSDGRRIMILYVGGLSNDRGIKELLEVVKEMPDLVTLLVGGQGIMEDLVRQYSAKYENVSYMGQVEYEEVLKLTSVADILYAVYNPDFETNKSASPNKFFEAIAYGKPIIVAKGTSINDKVAEYNMGYVVDYSQESLKITLLSLRKYELCQKGLNATKAWGKYNWIKMKNELASIYHCL